MKKHLLFLSALLLSVTALFAQAPQKMSYQAVVRNTNNTLVTNQSVSAKISILQGGVNGTPVYVETHFVTTNANGLLTLEVGNGTAVSGSMATVNWANGPYFLKSEIDPDGGINYSIEGTQQLLSVPYALYAEKAGNVPAFGIVPVDSGYVISVVQPGGTPQTYFLPTGGQGPAGPAGNDGLSAYQLWLNAGNTGSEADFLASLVGTPGNDGNDGQDGVGIDSVAKTGSVANVDTYTIYYSNHTTSTYTVTNGVDGTPGDPGSPGDPGTPGFSPTITVDTGAAGMVLTITDVNGTNQYLIPTGGGSSSGGTIVQQQVNWNETNPASVTYILNKPSLATVATSGNYNDLLNKPTIPTNISQLNNDAGYLTGQDVTNLNNNVSNLSNSVSNMSNSVNNLQSSIDTMQNNISNLQQTVANIPAPVQSNWNETNTASPAYIQNKPTIPTVPTNVSAFQNDAGYITNAAVPTFNVTQTDTGYVLTMTPPGGNAQQYVLRNGVDGENGSAGNGISYVTGPVTSGNVDTYTIHYTNGTTSNFTVTNGTNGQNGLSPTINVTTGDAGTVLTITDATGTHQHTIPNSSSSGGTIVQQQVNWNETNPSSVSYILNKPNLATVATSGSYNDLLDKPEIPTVPTNVSAFTNDAGYITMDSIPQAEPQVNADWNATSGVAEILNKPDISGMQHTIDSLQDALGNLQDALYFICGTSTVQDYDGNEYNTVKIGNQCWLKENLRTTHYNDGTEIAAGTDTSLTIPYRYVPNGDEANVPAYGYLYNWAAAMNGEAASDDIPSGVQGICPKGWHLPSQAEWTQLIDYVQSQSDYACIIESATYGTEYYYSKALASTTGWNASTSACYPGNDPEANNITGFGAMPAGYWYYYNATSREFGTDAYFWGATQGSSSNYANRIDLYSRNISNGTGYKTNGYSVRCVYQPEVTDALNVIQNLQNHIDSLQTELNHQRENANYAIGELQDAMSGFVCGTSTVQDYDGNEYNTVKVGNQCWLKENLRTTHYNNGTAIAAGTDTSSSVAYRYAPNNDTSNVAAYGYLYNWTAVMNGEAASSTNPSGVQGICPEGWHLPSAAELTQLKDYVSSQSEYACEYVSTWNESIYYYYTKALASNTGWNSNSSNPCYPSYDMSSNNATGFSAMPAGFFTYAYSSTSSPYREFGTDAYFWTSSTGRGINTAQYLDLYGTAISITQYGNSKYRAHSVRCLRNVDIAETSLTPLAQVAFTGDYSDLINTPQVTQGADGRGIVGITGPESNPDMPNVDTYTIYYTDTTTSTFTVTNGIDGQDGQDGVSPTVSIQQSDNGMMLVVTDATGTNYYTIPNGGSSSSTQLPANWAETNQSSPQYILNKPNLAPVATSGSYNDLSDKPEIPTVPTTVSAFRNDAGYITGQNIQQYLPEVPAQVKSDWDELDTASAAYIKNKPTIPAAQVNADWNATSGVAQILHKPNLAPVATTGNYNDLTNTPEIPTVPTNVSAFQNDAGYITVQNIQQYLPEIPAQVKSDWNELDTASAAYIKNKPVIPENMSDLEEDMGYITADDLEDLIPEVPEQVKSDWAEYDTSSVAYIKNKPTIFTYDDIQNMINNSLGSLNDRIDSLENALNAAHQAEQQNSNLTFVCGTSKMYDYEGNAYNTVKIGNQCWAKENLRTSHFADGTAIDPVFGSGYDHRDGNAPAFTTYSTPDQRTDYIYNMAAAFHGLPSQVYNMDQDESGATTGRDQQIQGLCPDGWHLPSDADWYNLTNTLSNNGMYCGQNSSYIAKALASDNANTWGTSTENCAIGNDLSANNASGFSAVGNLLAYFEPNNNGGYTSGGMLAQNGAHFWSSTPQLGWGQYQIPYAMDTVSCFELTFSSPTVTQGVYYNKYNLMAVRCMRDEADGTLQQMQQTIEELQQQVNQQSQLPSVYISSVTSDGATKAKATAYAYANNGELILAKGFCWSGLENPTVGGYNCSYTLVDTTTTTFLAPITNLRAGDTYYFRAFATTANGTAYSTQQTYTHVASIPASGSETMTLYNGQEIWIYDNGGPDGNYTNNCNGSLTINASSSSYQVMIDTVIYTTESNYDKLYVYSGTSANDTFLLETLHGTGTATGIYPDNGTGSLTLKFASDHSAIYTGFAIKVKLVSMCPATVYKSVYYNTVRIGEQCWIKENLRYGAGTLQTATSPTVSSTNAYRYYPNNTSNNLNTHGYLYNFAAICNGSTATSGMQGICPSGWHIPTYAELVKLRTHETDLTDANGFAMNYPGRVYTGSTSGTGNFTDFGQYGTIWGINTNGAAVVLMIDDNHKTGMLTTGANAALGYSLRCIKNQ